VNKVSNKNSFHVLVQFALLCTNWNT